MSKFIRCEICNYFCALTGGSEWECPGDTKLQTIPIDAVFGSDWRDDLPTDEEEEEDAHNLYILSRNIWLDNKDFFNAWHFLNSHPANRIGYGKMGYEAFAYAYDIMVVKVNPISKRIESHNGDGGAEACPKWNDWSGCECQLKQSNIETNVWIEWGPPCDERHEGGSFKTHDVDVDTGGSTFEEAICNLADNVWHKYQDSASVSVGWAADITPEWIELDQSNNHPLPNIGDRVSIYINSYHLDDDNKLIYEFPDKPKRLFGFVEALNDNLVKVSDRIYDDSKYNR